MSLFKRKRLYISLELDRIALVEVAGRWRPQPVADQIVEVRCTSGAPEGALAALADMLSGLERRKADICVTLSNRLVKHLVLDPVPGARNARELRQALAERMLSTFGLESGDWECRIGLEAHPQRMLGCVAPRRLLEGLREVCQTGGGATLAIAPYFVSEFNRWRRQFRPGPIWLGVLERNSLCLSLLNAGTWQGIRLLPTGGTPLDVLPAALSRERMYHDLSESEQHIYLTGIDEESPIAAPMASNTVVLGAPQWPGRCESWSANYRLALSSLWP